MKEFLQQLRETKEEIAKIKEDVKVQEAEENLLAIEEANEVDELKKAIDSDRDALEIDKISVENLRDEVEKLEISLKGEELEMEQAIIAAQERADKSKQDLEEASEQLKLLTNASDVETLDDAVNRFKKEGETRCKAARDECTKLRLGKFQIIASLYFR